MVGHLARMEVDGGAFKIVTDKPTKKRSLGRPRRRRENSIRMALKDIVVIRSKLID